MKFKVINYEIFESGGGCTDVWGECIYRYKKWWFMGEIKPFQSITIYDNDPRIASEHGYLDNEWQERHLIAYIEETKAKKIVNKLIKGITTDTLL